jgi:hypothetical protein
MNKVLTIYKGGRTSTTHELVLYTERIDDMVVYQFEGGPTEVIYIINTLEASGVIKVTSDEWAHKDELLNPYFKAKCHMVRVGINPVDILSDYKKRIKDYKERTNNHE